MKIKQVYFVKGHAAFYFDDQKAIKDGAVRDGFLYEGRPVTSGFKQVRQAGENISIMLELENGATAQGDCVAVQYSGAGGRDPLFTSEHFIPFMEEHIKPLLLGRSINSFKENAEFFDELVINDQPLHTAIRYGLSQALLDATAIAQQSLKVDVICYEYQLPVSTTAVPLLGQSGDDRYAAVDKMILKKVDALPHALINSVPDKLGHDGRKLGQYIQWLVKRIFDHRGDLKYHPDLHIDVYGTIGMIFDNDIDKIVSYLGHLEWLCSPFDLYIEGPVDMGNRDEQIVALKTIKDRIKDKHPRIKIVADEWCNTYEDIVAFVDADCCHMVQIKTPDLGSVHNTVRAVMYCKENGVQAYQGGTCNETDVSAKTCVHLALATQPERMLAKPGMGFDEGMTIVHNEMHRTLTMLKARQEQSTNVEKKEVCA